MTNSEDFCGDILFNLSVNNKFSNFFFFWDCTIISNCVAVCDGFIEAKGIIYSKGEDRIGWAIAREFLPQSGKRMNPNGFCWVKVQKVYVKPSFSLNLSLYEKRTRRRLKYRDRSYFLHSYKSLSLSLSPTCLPWHIYVCVCGNVSVLNCSCIVLTYTDNREKERDFDVFTPLSVSLSPLNKHQT